MLPKKECIMKKCRTCKEMKPFDDFHKWKYSKDGFKGECKICIKKYIDKTKEKGYQKKTKKNSEGYLKKNGYKKISRVGHPNSDMCGKIFEHTYVMSEFLGRPLKKKETIHHKNGIISDNRIDNLELFDSRHGPGQSVNEKIYWCIQFLNEYGYIVSKE